MNKNLSITYGFLAGIAVIGYYLLFYWVDRTLLFNPYVVWGSLPIYLVAMILAVLKERRNQDEYTFQMALRTAFVVFIVASCCYYLFYYLLYNYLDPDMLILQKDYLFERREEFVKWMGTRGANEYFQRLEQEGIQVTVSDTLFSLGRGLIGGFIFALPIAGLLRKK